MEHLAHKLREEGLEPFLDKWDPIPGEPWQEALEEALDQSRTCAVFIGKAWGSDERRAVLGGEDYMAQQPVEHLFIS